MPFETIRNTNGVCQISLNILIAPVLCGDFCTQNYCIPIRAKLNTISFVLLKNVTQKGCHPLAKDPLTFPYF